MAAGERGSYVTKEVIRQAFLGQIETKDVSRVKVSELVSDAHVSKTTFYRYYEDVYDLMMDCFFTYLWENPDSDQSQNHTLLGMHKVRKYPRLFVMCHRCPYEPFVRKFEEGPISRSVETTLDYMSGLGISGDNCVIETRRLARLYIDMTIDVVLEWIDDGLRESPEEVANILLTCRDRFFLAMCVDVS